MMITMRRKRGRGVVMVIVIMMMIIMKTYQVPYSQGQMHTLVLHLLKKRPEAISYCNCNWRRYVEIYALFGGTKLTQNLCAGDQIQF